MKDDSSHERQASKDFNSVSKDLHQALKKLNNDELGLDYMPGVGYEVRHAFGALKEILNTVILAQISIEERLEKNKKSKSAPANPKKNK